MKRLQAEELLEAWEHGLSRPMLQRMLVVIAAAFPDLRPGELLGLSIGRRDSLLLKLREYLFGPKLHNTTSCPGCGKLVEWESRVSELTLDHGDRVPEGKEHELDVDGYLLRFALPNTLHVSAAIDEEDAVAAERQLLAGCLRSIQFGGSPRDAGQLPDSVIESLSERIATLDPQADIRIDLTCPDCAHGWDVRFDIASYLWTEINDWAQHMLRVVGRLAATYGWTEREILRLSPLRRAAYLGMLDH